jgi:hypothetical protein
LLADLEKLPKPWVRPFICCRGFREGNSIELAVAFCQDQLWKDVSAAEPSDLFWYETGQ